MAGAMVRRSCGLLLLCAMVSLRCGGGDDEDKPGSVSGAGGSGGSQASGAGGSGDGGGAPGTDAACTPGETRECVGPGSCEGGQACRDDGAGWDACDCGSNGAGGAAGEGGSGGNAAEDPCDPVLQTGCADSEKCTLEATSDPGVMAPVCAPNGNKHVGELCTLVDGADDCRAGSRCSGSAAFCHAMCDVEDETTCASSCRPNFEVEGSPNFGLCEPACDAFEQNCPSGQSCIFTPTDAYPFCAPLQDPVGLGEICPFSNQCEEGMTCLTNNSNSDPVCTYLCDARGLGGPSCGDAEGPGSDNICMPLSFYDKQADGVGLCLSCSLFTTPWDNCPLLQAGGCDADEDCTPLEADIPEDFVCNLDLDRCVVAP